MEKKDPDTPVRHPLAVDETQLEKWVALRDRDENILYAEIILPMLIGRSDEAVEKGMDPETPKAERVKHRHYYTLINTLLQELHVREVRLAKKNGMGD